MRQRVLLFSFVLVLVLLWSAFDSLKVDYLILVNRNHSLPSYWDSIVNLVPTQSVDGEMVYVEEETLIHFRELQQDLLLKYDIDLQIDSAYRDYNTQKELANQLRAQYGVEYVNVYVAIPGFSEHETGLAIDFTLVKHKVLDKVLGHNDNKAYEQIHSILHKHGFILRYLAGKEVITGYGYERWHIRYVGEEAAKDIYERKITLEEYLNIY